MKSQIQNTSDNQKKEQIIEKLPQLISQTLENLNYSFNEFHYLQTKALSYQEFECPIISVITIFIRQSTIDLFNEAMVLIVMFLLNFNDETYTYFFLKYLYETFIPDRFINQIQLDQEMEFLVELAKTNFLIDQSELIYLRKFLTSNSFEILQSLFVNKVNIPCCLFLFDYFLKFQDFYECEKTLITICKFNLTDIRQSGLDKNYILKTLVNHTEINWLKGSLSQEDRMVVSQIKRKSKGNSDDVFKTFKLMKSQSNTQSGQETEHSDQLLQCLEALADIIDGRENPNRLDVVLGFLGNKEQKHFNYIKKTIEFMKNSSGTDEKGKENSSLGITEQSTRDGSLSIPNRKFEELESHLGDLKNQKLELELLNQKYQLEIGELTTLFQKQSQNQDQMNQLKNKIAELEQENEKVKNEREDQRVELKLLEDDKEVMVKEHEKQMKHLIEKKDKQIMRLISEYGEVDLQMQKDQSLAVQNYFSAREQTKPSECNIF